VKLSQSELNKSAPDDVPVGCWCDGGANDDGGGEPKSTSKSDDAAVEWCTGGIPCCRDESIDCAVGG